MSAWRGVARRLVATAVAGRAGWRLIERRLPDVVVVFLWHGFGGPGDRVGRLFFDQEDLARGRSSLCPLDVFRVQLDFIGERFRLVPLAEAVARLAAGPPFGRLAAITFDDGFKSVCDLAAPELERRQFPACIFVNAALASGGRLKATDVLNAGVNRLGATVAARLCREHGLPADERTVRRDQRPLVSAAAWPRARDAILGALGQTEASLASETEAYATWEDLAQLPRPLFSFGNHGARHLSLPSLDRAELEREIVDGARALKERLNTDDAPYAYAFGGVADVTPDAIAIARQQHRVICSAYGGFNLPRRPLTDVRRVPVFSTPDPAMLAEYTFRITPLARALIGWRSG
jgi:peptidoglycan/xylan/chitin deacetylase (PgdA/CDA1 family)